MVSSSRRCSSIVLHDAAPRRADHCSLRLGDKAMVTGPRAKARKIHLQLRQIHHRPGRRPDSLREINGLIEKFPQKSIFLRVHFTNGHIHIFSHSTLLTGWRMTVFSRSGWHRRTSLK